MALTTVVSSISPSTLERLSGRSRSCIERLRNCKLERPDLSRQPTVKLAAVLVLLYEEAGKLRVLLTTRSKQLRSHPGQTALPGGKVDDCDPDLVHAALREAYEEVGLDFDASDTLCVLPPFLSASQLLVTPVVALLKDTSTLEQLKPSVTEVDHIFNHPLEALLDPTLVSEEPNLTEKGSENWPYEADYHTINDVNLPTHDNLVYRNLRFRSSASPVKGLTAEILILVAEIAYNSSPKYNRYSPGQAESTANLIRLRMQQYEL
ncbi:NUDIX hydrolase domain-like protein [Hygrophoropsis aurantiaca]|uniref:NUDIX hydrolase domain-like protein n=1 Tax=Hygrophoropsis aurantiaca TaxID=72124 RepID=A0ACB8AGG7_9AGAM|nr:NUDIX hydrolase domain-like protein [Hygrophoropsis aurantiaca]